MVCSNMSQRLPRCCRWAFGVVLYQLLVGRGRYPYMADGDDLGDDSAVEARIMAGKISVPPHIVVSLPLLLPVCASCRCPNGIPALQLPVAKQVIAMVGLQLRRPPANA
jgi:hypothetical protein